LRRHPLLTAGLAVALLIGGAASPGHAGAPAGQIDGDGRTANVALFSVKVRQDKLAKGRLDYRSVDGRFKVRCNGFDTYTPRLYIQPGPPAAVVTGDCVLEGPRRQRTLVEVEAEFVDHSSFTRRAKDEANITFTLPDDEEVVDSGRILSGSITFR
jgi:hypothetical protein